MITMKDIVREGHPALRKVASHIPVPPTEKDINTLNEMLAFVKNSQDDEIAEKYELRSGVGIAAPQLGINKRMIAVYFRDFNDKLYSYSLINPKIISHSVEKAYLGSGEGCLSVDRDVDGFVVRYARITIQALDIDGNPIKLRLRGYASIVLQHEIDHLNGVMFFDHIDKSNPFFVPNNAKEID